MSKMWAGRSESATAQVADDFNSSIHFDCRMYEQDIMGSMAHAAMEPIISCLYMRQSKCREELKSSATWAVADSLLPAHILLICGISFRSIFQITAFPAP